MPQRVTSSCCAPTTFSYSSTTTFTFFVMLVAWGFEEEAEGAATVTFFLAPFLPRMASDKKGLRLGRQIHAFCNC